MNKVKTGFAVLMTLGILSACSATNTRGIADKRSDFRKFLPMQSNPERDGLKPVRPFFRSADRAQIILAIERACRSRRSGASFEDARTGAGYYVNCNPGNRQLLNGYLPLTKGQEPRSR